MEVPKWEARKCSNGRDKVHLWVKIEAYRMMKDESWWSLGVIVIGQWGSDIQKETSLQRYSMMKSLKRPKWLGIESFFIPFSSENEGISKKINEWKNAWRLTWDLIQVQEWKVTSHESCRVIIAEDRGPIFDSALAWDRLAGRPRRLGLSY